MKMRRMRILFSIRIFMVGLMHESVGARIQKSRALGHKGKEVKYPINKVGELEHSMGSVPMKEEGLAKKRNVPVHD
jgi:hypothetical protein